MMNTSHLPEIQKKSFRLKTYNYEIRIIVIIPYKASDLVIFTKLFQCKEYKQIYI